MKKILLFAPLFAAAAWFAACDDTNEEPPIDYVQQATEAIDTFNVKYDLEAVLDVDTATFRYASPDGSMFWYERRITPEGDTVPDFLGQYYVQADPSYVDKVLNFLEDEVFPVFGTEFIQNYMPRKIYFASEMQYNPYYCDYNIALRSLYCDVHSTFEGGTCCPEFIMFSHCCPDFDTMDKNYLKRLYVSLICEYIYSYALNQEGHPLNNDNFAKFKQIGYDYTTGTDFGFMLFTMNENCAGYYDSDASDSEFPTGWLNLDEYSESADEWKNFSFGGEETWHMWNAWLGCELRPGRVGLAEIYLNPGHSDSTITAPVKYTYYRTSHAQALGDYVAFIVTTTKSEKEAFWAEVEAAVANPDNLFYGLIEYDEETSTYGTLGEKVKSDLLPDMQKRMELAKEIFADLGVTLADKPE